MVVARRRGVARVTRVARSVPAPDPEQEDGEYAQLTRAFERQEQADEHRRREDHAAPPVAVSSPPSVDVPPGTHLGPEPDETSSPFVRYAYEQIKAMKERLRRARPSWWQSVSFGTLPIAVEQARRAQDLAAFDRALGVYEAAVMRSYRELPAPKRPQPRPHVSGPLPAPLREMLGFSPGQVDAIGRGLKTQATRRSFKAAEFRVGRRLPVVIMTPCIVEITEIVTRRLGALTDADAQAECGQSLAEFRAWWQDKYGTWDPDLEVVTLRFIADVRHDVDGFREAWWR
jgi:hypothetical protein